MWSNTDVKPAKTFWENDQRPEFWLISWPKMAPKNWTSEAHIPHTTESTCGEHVKEYWCETVKTFWERDQSPEFWLTLGFKEAQKLGLWDPSCTRLWKWPQWAYKVRLMWIQRKLFNKILENVNFDSIGCPKGLQSLGLWGLFFAHLQKKLLWACKWSFVWIQWRILKKRGENIYIDLFWPTLTYWEPKMARIFGPQGLFSHTPESTHNVPVNQLSWSHIKNFLRKWPKTSTPPF